MDERVMREKGVIERENKERGERKMVKDKTERETK